LETTGGSKRRRRGGVHQDRVKGNSMEGVRSDDTLTQSHQLICGGDAAGGKETRNKSRATREQSWESVRSGKKVAIGFQERKGTGKVRPVSKAPRQVD